MTTVLVTRPADRADTLSQLLAQQAIGAVHVPTVAIDLEADAAGLARALTEIGDAAWLVVTSANGALAVGKALGGRFLPNSLRVAAVGPATAEALRAAAIRVDVVPPRYLTAAIADALGDVQGLRVVLARADRATPALRQALRERGARAEEVVAYRTIVGPAASGERLRRVVADGVDAVVFTSGSAVRGLIALLPAHLRARVARIPTICIGPVTAEVAQRSGFWVAAVADEHTARGVAVATIEHLATRHAS